jgi:uncharacterized protein YkwD
MKYIFKVFVVMFTCMIILSSSLFSTTFVSAKTDDEFNVLLSVKYGQTEGRSIFNMVNKLRAGSDAWYWNSDDKTKTVCSGLSQLKYDYALEKVAMQRAAEIAIYYSHTRPSNETCWAAYSDLGYSASALGENIAAGYDNANDVFVGWSEADEMYAGQGHRRNMLSTKFNAIGIGHCYYNGVDYWVQEFSSSAKSETYTSPLDSTTEKSIKIAKSNVTYMELSTDNSDIYVKPGETLPLPQCELKMTLTETWPERVVDVSVTPEYCTTNDLITINGSEFTAVTYGTEVLNLTFLDKTEIININIVDDIPVTHNYIYDNNYDGTHTKTCKDKGCDYSVEEKCSYENGECIYCQCKYETGTYGDVNNDGEININDVTLIQKHLAKLVELNDFQLIYASMGASKLTISSATKIQKYISDIDNEPLLGTIVNIYHN